MDENDRRKVRQAWQSAKRAPTEIKIPRPKYSWLQREELWAGAIGTVLFAATALTR
jgi:hypothetical protein